MASNTRSKTMVLLLFVQLCFLLFSSSIAFSPGSAEGYTINGRVKIESMGAQEFILPGKISNIKIILNGGQRVTFLRPDGYFSFHNVPAGTHLIEVDAIGYFFSPVRVDYYEIREPFSIMSIVKSPMGLMMGFMLIVVFLMPKLMENVDPEEMRRAQEEMRNQGVPTLASLLPGAGRSS
ncbi:ER membrane protein complex subunit 7-like [Quillaja saponaria]|uniref:ER membrane protein complex subunit 7-like n=1 Tax=Quillaja saponaria TaxID=32244 RepID=A0AAD7PSD6_QUISA|nr:ER membrane protein complex subunit 7-like [Quillaja saponaria]